MNRTDFQIETIETGAAEFVVALTGDIDLYTAPTLKSELLRLSEHDAKTVVVDLTRTTFIDSSTLGVLLGALKRLRVKGGEIVLVCTDPNLRKIFEITLLDRVFTIFDTRDSALGLSH